MNTLIAVAIAPFGVGDELAPYVAEAIARQIIRAEKHRPIRTTRELYAVIEAALEKVRLPRDAAGKVPDRRDIIGSLLRRATFPP